MRKLGWLIAGMVLLLPTACDRVTEEEQACLDTANLIADAWENCGYDREAKLAEEMTRLLGCEDVVRIRDEDELRNQCFPAIVTMDCTDLEDDVYPDPCLEQILY